MSRLNRFETSCALRFAVFTGAVFGLATPMTAQVQSTADSIRACFVPGSGTIYRIKTAKAPAACTDPQHVEFGLQPPTAGLAAVKGGGGTSLDHGALAGLTDDDHPQYLLGDGIRTVTDGFAVVGTMGTGTIPINGAGTRLMWYPGNASFFAGWTNGNHEPVSGNGAVALGLNPAANGDGAFATSASRATAPYSVAMGGGLAQGTHSLAFGASATLVASTSAIAMGNAAFAYGPYSVAIGADVRASGAHAVSMGQNTVALGANSMVLGLNAGDGGKAGAFVWGDGSSALPVRAVSDNQFVARAAKFWFGSGNSVTSSFGRFIETSTGAFLSSGGTWTNSSDVNRKENFAQVDGEEILDRLAAMPIQSWNYRDEDASVRHLGPTAQDFRAAYGLGATETGIATVDADGVALAAIQALEVRTKRQEQEIESLRAALTELQLALKATRNPRAHR